LLQNKKTQPSQKLLIVRILFFIFVSLQAMLQKTKQKTTPKKKKENQRKIIKLQKKKQIKKKTILIIRKKARNITSIFILRKKTHNKNVLRIKKNPKQSTCFSIFLSHAYHFPIFFCFFFFLIS
jgi:ATP-dependent Zn protease